MKITKATRWRVFAGVWIQSLFTSATAFFSLFCLPFCNQFGWSNSDFSMAYTIYMFIYCAVGFLGGILAEKLQPRVAIYIGLVLFAGGWILTGFASSIPFLYIAYGVIAGAGAGTIYPACLPTALKWFPDKSGSISGLVQAGAACGPFIMSPIAQMLIDNFGAPMACKILGVVFLIGVGAVAWMIVGGLEKVYEIGRVFRNEGLDTRHNPEFTLMELYQAYTDYHGMMDLTENLYRFVAQEVLGTTHIVYKGIEMDLGKPFERITMVDAVKKYAGVDWNEVKDLEQARVIAKEHNIEFEERHKKGDILNLFFEEYVEEHLLQPTFVMDHPIEISPLTKKKPENPEYVERFEFFMNGWEMANAYSELNDPIDQRERFKAQEELLAQGDDEANTTDEDFMNALEIGMPPTGGIGFGIDRMCMLLTGAEAIRDVLLFPTMKSIDK